MFKFETIPVDLKVSLKGQTKVRHMFNIDCILKTVSSYTVSL